MEGRYGPYYHPAQLAAVLAREEEERRKEEIEANKKVEILKKHINLKREENQRLKIFTFIGLLFILYLLTFHWNSIRDFYGNFLKKKSKKDKKD